MFKRSDVKDIYSLSAMQEGMLFHYIIDKDTNIFFEQLNLRIHGEIRHSLFQQAFNKLVEKYDVLRTVFVYKNTPKPRQVVLKKREATVGFEDLSRGVEDEKEKEVANFKKKERETKYNLTRDIPMRFSLVKISENKYEIVWSFHHIIMDGWCTAILLKEILSYYGRFLRGETVILSDSAPYSDYIRWLEKQDKDTGLDYWRNYLEDYETPAILPKTGSGAGNTVQAELTFQIPRELGSCLKGIAHDNQVTLNSIFQLAWGILLQNYNKTSDVIFGSVVSGRPTELANVETIIGLFMNTIPLRVKSQPGEKFIHMLKKLQQDMVASRQFDYMPLVEVLATTPLKQALVDHVIVFENYPLDIDFFNAGLKKELGISLEGVYNYSEANYDLDITFIPMDETAIRIKYNPSVYNSIVMGQVKAHMINILMAAAADSACVVDNISMLTEAEKQRLTLEFNSNKIDYPLDKTIHQLFEEQADKEPEKTALNFNETRLSYKGLKEKSNRLAKILLARGIGRDRTVGILMERSPLMVTAILAIWKAGGAYIPLDTKYPVQRITGILTDSESSFLITLEQHILPELTEEYAGPLLAIDRLESEIAGQERNDPGLKIETADLAYVIYTSGSTGKPKGVMVEHRGMTNHMWAKINDLQLTPGSIVAQNASHCFDISIWQFFAALSVGGTTVIYPNRLTYDPLQFIDRVTNDGITILEVVPSYLSAMLDNPDHSTGKFKHLQYLLVTGETVKTELVKKWFEKYPSIKMMNAYGPTEASDDITHYLMEKEPQMEQIPIGYPVQNLNLYIVDRNMKLCPVGVKGEICVSGIGVGRGYLKDAEKTRAVFLEDPFREEEGIRMYKTGDLGRLSPEGYIDFFGRIDHQVKIRGFRIELGEIETGLMKHKDIKEAVVIVSTTDTGDTFLCAYYTSKKELSVSPLRKTLASDLPDYMIPSYFIKLDSMPLTPNGKIDRKALPHPEGEIDTGVEYAPPETPVQELLVNAWQDVLGVVKVGIDDDYFALGGDSIKAIQVASRLYNKELKLEIQHLMEVPNIRELSAYIKPLKQTGSQEPVEGDVKLTPIQKWFFENDYTDMFHINQAFLLKAKKSFHRQTVEKVFTQLVRHHDALRIVFETGDAKVKQINRGIAGKLFDLEFFDLLEENVPETVIEEKCMRIQGEMDLKYGPLLKLGLFKTRDGDYLLLACHHLVIDGVSWRIILEDFASAYGQAEKGETIELPLKTTSFKEWAEGLHEYCITNKLLQELAYWQQLQEAVVLPLPKNRTTDDFRVMNSKVEALSLSEEYTMKLLKETNHAYNTEINDILLTGLAMALKDWTGKDNALLDIEGHGREDIIEDIVTTRTVGWFTSLFPLVLHTAGMKDIPGMIKNTKEMLRQVPQKGIGFGILKYITPSEYKAGFPFNLQPEIKFNYLGQFDEDFETELFSLGNVSAGNPVSLNSEREYLLDIYGMVTGGTLTLSVSYNEKECDKENITSLTGHYKSRLQQIIDHCTGREDTELTLSDFSSTQMDNEDMESMFDVLADKFGE
ncbi:MAG: amino acid adenylation domain-containing protein [bacterium]|nr:amino acid adenylation domain-containing protein [bacterium]